MSQLLVALLSGGAVACASGVAALVRIAYQRGKGAWRAEATLENLQQAQAQTGRTLEEIAARVTRLERNGSATAIERHRKA